MLGRSCSERSRLTLGCFVTRRPGLQNSTDGTGSGSCRARLQTPRIAGHRTTVRLQLTAAEWLFTAHRPPTSSNGTDGLALAPRGETIVVAGIRSRYAAGRHLAPPAGRGVCHPTAKWLRERARLEQLSTPTSNSRRRRGLTLPLRRRCGRDVESGLRRRRDVACALAGTIHRGPHGSSQRSAVPPPQHHPDASSGQARPVFPLPNLGRHTHA